MSKGVDYSFARPGGQAVKDAGFTFAMRYLSDYPVKNISPGEAADLKAHGIAIGLVFENAANDALGGYAVGVANAKKALDQARAIGFPDSLPIYFAVDFDATEAQQAPIDSYLKGAAEVLGAGRVGIYGGYYPVMRAAQNGTAKYFWQTLAWSGGQVFDKVHIYQNGQTALNGGADVNEGRQDNIGVWGANEGSVPPAPAQSPSPAAAEYVVKAGDTLSGIAAKYGTTYQALAALNGIADPNKINVGQVIKTAGSPAPTSQANGATYTVKPGDTLSAIGTRFGVDYHTLATVNGIADPNKIYAGQTLRIPGTGSSNPAPGGVTYVVKSGDTLSGIADAYHTTYQHLAQINGIADPNKINAGQVIRIG